MNDINSPYPSYAWEPFYVKIGEPNVFRKGDVIKSGFSQTPHKVLKAYKDNWLKKRIRAFARWLLKYASRVEGEYKVQAIHHDTQTTQ
jgi:hypothetical protein